MTLILRAAAIRQKSSGIKVPQMKREHHYLLLLLLVVAPTDEVGRTALDDFIVPFRALNFLRMTFLTNTKRQNKSFWDNDKLQDPIPDSVPFPCDVQSSRSSAKPRTVHELRPGDIDVVGAIGDSLTVGFGLTATNVLEVLYEERGKSFSIGGEGTWRQYTTIPNILKVFNPNLTGYSLDNSLSIQPSARLNVAEVGARSEDTPYMARELIRRIKSDGRINLDEDWKMITIFIGANDFCSEICYLRSPELSLKRHEKDLTEVLRLLRDHLPRTLVNLAVAPHLRVLVELKVNPSCYWTQTFSCPCLIGLPFKNLRNLMYSIMDRWQKIDIEIANLDEFDTDDFTVVAQPLALGYTLPTISGRADHRYLSSDCFHWSQRMDAKVSLDLWNNLLEPVGNKSINGAEFMTKFNCPNEKYPYIFTRRNSPL